MFKKLQVAEVLTKVLTKQGSMETVTGIEVLMSQLEEIRNLKT